MDPATVTLLFFIPTVQILSQIVRHVTEKDIQNLKELHSKAVDKLNEDAEEARIVVSGKLNKNGLSTSRDETSPCSVFRDELSHLVNTFKDSHLTEDLIQQSSSDCPYEKDLLEALSSRFKSPEFSRYCSFRHCSSSDFLLYWFTGAIFSLTGSQRICFRSLSEQTGNDTSKFLRVRYCPTKRDRDLRRFNYLPDFSQTCSPGYLQAVAAGGEFSFEQIKNNPTLQFRITQAQSTNTVSMSTSFRRLDGTRQDVFISGDLSVRGYNYGSDPVRLFPLFLGECGNESQFKDEMKTGVLALSTRYVKKTYVLNLSEGVLMIKQQWK
ncbi:hypothetical protein HK098_000959 [Nowakowskiella sp. JEL0407]|nr:hypothetical protein HK098_000959 [Nowakowskiella sp. JEL0407]